LDYISYVFTGFDINWHHQVIADKLEKVEKGEIKRIMFLLPPRHSKSEMGSKMFPSWFLGKNPNKEVIMCSYAADLAVDFGRKVRNLVDSRLYQNIFKIKLAQDSKSAGRWNTNQGGAYVATGVGGGITGKGAHILVIDDPHKSRKEAESEVKRQESWDWYRSTAYTRLAPDGAIILILTRWHEDDLAGKLLAEQEQGGDKWEVVNFPAIAEKNEKYRDIGEALWPNRYSVDQLENIKKAIGSREWSSLYQQNPHDNIGAEFKKIFYKHITREEAENKRVARYLTIDPALSEGEEDDNTGWIENIVDINNHWHISAKRLRINSAELINTLINEHDDKHYDKIGIEEEKYFKAIKPFLKEKQEKLNKFLPIYPLPHKGRAKVLRIRGLIPRYEAGMIYHIKGECFDLQDEQGKFPTARFDDLLDAEAYQNDLVESQAPVSDRQEEIRREENKKTPKLKFN